MQTPEFQDWIGRRSVSADIASPRLLAEFRACLAPHLFEPRNPELAPPGLHWGLAPATPAMAELGEDGSEAKGRLIPPIPVPQRMWAGGRVETIAPIRIGATIQRLTSVERVERRNGTSGLLYFVSLRHEVEADGRLSVSERQDLVFREASSRAGEGRKEEGSAGGLEWNIVASPVLLFRFSAFTFNGHRIHYDESYSRSEGYTGLLVQGPLQAVLMFNQLSVLLGQVPRRFDYRCIAPLVSGPGMKVVSHGLESRIMRPDGIIAAEGRAHAPDT